MPFLPAGWIEVPGCYTGPEEGYAQQLAWACSFPYSTCPCPGKSLIEQQAVDYIDNFLPGLQGEYGMMTGGGLKSGCCCGNKAGSGAQKLSAATSTRKPATPAPAKQGISCWWWILAAFIIIICAGDER